MTIKNTIKFTANFERNLDEIEVFLTGAQAANAFDILLSELSETVIPNLERFPRIGRSFLEQPALSVEVANAIARLTRELELISSDTELREYVMTHFLLLYAKVGSTIYLLSVRHHRQLSFNFKALWKP